jgi:hypothetical protein
MNIQDLTEDQREIIERAVEAGRQTNLWINDYKILIKGDPDWGKVDTGLEYVTNVPSRFNGRGSLYRKQGWPGRVINVIYLNVDDEIGVFILSRMSYIQCTMEPIEYLLREF